MSSQMQMNSKVLAEAARATIQVMAAARAERTQNVGPRLGRPIMKQKTFMYKYLLYIQNSENNLLLTKFHSLTWPLHQVCVGKCLAIQYSEKNYSLQYCFLII